MQGLLPRFIFIIVICAVCAYVYEETILVDIKARNNEIKKNLVEKREIHQQEIDRALQQTGGGNGEGSGLSREQLEEWFYKLHELYYNGVPDKYDAIGNKIKGVEPEPKKAIYYLSRAAGQRGDPMLWMKLASIYQNGMYNFDPDLNTAALYYSNIHEKYHSPNVRQQALEAYNECIQETNTIKTYKWLNLPYSGKKNQHHEKIKKQRQPPKTQTPRPLATMALGGATAVVERNNFFLGNHAPVGAGVGAGAGAGAAVFDIDNIANNDMHNTHNSQVVATVANSVRRLKENTDINTDAGTSINQIRQWLGTKPRTDKTADAQSSLDSIERNIIPVSSVDMKEVDVLNLVWNRINSKKHAETKDDIMDIFYGQLADMQEHGKSVCATGRLERLVDTLSTFDDNVQIKPTYVIDQEMMTKAGAIREAQYEGLTDDRAQQYKMGIAPDQDAFDESVKGKIMDTLKKDYVDTGIVTNTKFETMVNKWIDEI